MQRERNCEQNREQSAAHHDETSRRSERDAQVGPTVHAKREARFTTAVCLQTSAVSRIGDVTRIRPQAADGERLDTRLVAGIERCEQRTVAMMRFGNQQVGVARRLNMRTLRLIRPARDKRPQAILPPEPGDEFDGMRP